MSTKRPCKPATNKISCECDKYGCAHFSAGRCRIMPTGDKNHSGGKCVLPDRPHYLCCPFLNSPDGQGALEEWNIQVGRPRDSGKVPEITPDQRMDARRKRLEAL
jgi:hypothetical protein